MRLTLRRWTLLVSILLVAFGLRVWGLADHDIWWDEGIGIWLSRMPIWESIRWTAGDVHPPFYYVFLRVWRAIAGEGEFNLRFLSVIFSLLTVPLIYRLGKTLGGFHTGALAALFLGVSRFAIWWAQEIRMYAPAAFLATGSLWAAVWLWKATTQRTCGVRQDGVPHTALPWALYVVCTAGSLYTLYITATVVIVTNLGFLAYWVWQRRTKSRRAGALSWVTAQIAVVALFLPWAIYALPRMHSWSSDTPFTPGFFIQLYATILAVGNPLNLEANALTTVGAFVGLTLGAGVLAHHLIPVSSRTEETPSAPYRWGGLVMLAMGLLLPPLVVAVVALPGLRFFFSRPLVPRYLLPLSACYSALLAWGITTLGRPVPSSADATARPVPRYPYSLGHWLAIAVTGIALLAALSGLRSFYPGRVRHDDYTTIAEVLRAQRRVDEAVVLYVDRDWPVFVAHYDGERNDLPYGATLSDPILAETLLLPIWERTAAIWLVSTPESLQADPAQTVPTWLAAHSVLTRTMVSGGASLTYYTRTPDRTGIYEMVVPGTMPPIWVTRSFGLVGASLAQPRYGTGDTVHVGLYWIPPLPEKAEVIIFGDATERRYTVPAVTASANIVRNQVDIPLTSDLPGGTYSLHVVVPDYPPTPVGRFTLVRKVAGTGSALTAVSSPVEYRLGETIRLVGYALPATGVVAGETLALTLYWQTEATLSVRYKVFTHLLGETYNSRTGNFLWGQQDNEPVSGQAPTTLWAPDTVIADPYLIRVDADAPPGSYVVEVGMYGLVDGVRLAVAKEGDAIRLAEIEVKPATDDR